MNKENDHWGDKDPMENLNADKSDFDFVDAKCSAGTELIDGVHHVHVHLWKDNGRYISLHFKNGELYSAVNRVTGYR